MAPAPRKVTQSGVKQLTLDQLLPLIPPIFAESQHSMAPHRKNISSLRKLLLSAAEITAPLKSGVGEKMVGEKAFRDIVIECVNRILPVKKGVVQADRIVKLIGGFVADCVEKDATPEDSEEEIEEPTSARFINKLLNHLLKGMKAKDKNVRYRVCQLIAVILGCDPELDEDLFSLIRLSLLERARDKEPFIRVQAIIALGKFADIEADDEDEEDVTEVLLDVLVYDPSADVRRTAFFSLPMNPITLPVILARTRDVDTTIRSSIYKGAFSASSLPDFRILSRAQREEIVGNGLGDRDASVRREAGKMVISWIENCGEGIEGMLEFLNRFEIVDSKVIEHALQSVFEMSPDVFQAMVIADDFWSELTPEKAFLARVFVDHCKKEKDEARLEQSLPVVTFLAFKIQAEYNIFQTLSESENVAEESLAAQHFIISELLRLAVNLDYADETGRSKMLALVKEMVLFPFIVDSLIPRCLDVLRVVADDERDLIRMVVDVVTELRYDQMEEDDVEDALLGGAGGDEDESRAGSVPPDYASRVGRRRSKTPIGDSEEDQQLAMQKKIEVDMRCLLICISLLERVNGTLGDNSAFLGLVPDLIIPAVKMKVPKVREQGLTCLALVCLIDKKSAKNSFPLFYGQATDNQSANTLRVNVLKSLFDLLIVHDTDTLTGRPESSPVIVQIMREILCLDEGDYAMRENDAEVLAVGVQGIAKLMLAGMCTDIEILQELVRLYVSPKTADNQALRQCLSYFLPVYCYSSSSNQVRMQSIVLSALNELLIEAEDLEQDEEMVSLNTIALLLVDWTDPQKNAYFADESTRSKTDESIHVELATDFLKAILANGSEWVDQRKMFAQLLAKLYIPDNVDEWKLKAILLLIINIKNNKPLPDATSRTALLKFETGLTKRFPEKLKPFNEDDAVALDLLGDLFNYLDENLPPNTADKQLVAEMESASNRRKTSRRSLSKTPTPHDNDDAESVADSVLDATEEEASTVNGGNEETISMDESDVE